jgi:hypothetical protein
MQRDVSSDIGRGAFSQVLNAQNLKYIKEERISQQGENEFDHVQPMEMQISPIVTMPLYAPMSQTQESNVFGQYWNTTSIQPTIPQNIFGEPWSATPVQPFVSGIGVHGIQPHMSQIPFSPAINSFPFNQHAEEQLFNESRVMTVTKDRVFQYFNEIHINSKENVWHCKSAKVTENTSHNHVYCLHKDRLVLYCSHNHYKSIVGASCWCCSRILGNASGLDEHINSLHVENNSIICPLCRMSVAVTTDAKKKNRLLDFHKHIAGHISQYTSLYKTVDEVKQFRRKQGITGDIVESSIHKALMDRISVSKPIELNESFGGQGGFSDDDDDGFTISNPKGFENHSFGNSSNSSNKSHEKLLSVEKKLQDYLSANVVTRPNIEITDAVYRYAKLPVFEDYGPLKNEVIFDFVMLWLTHNLNNKTTDGFLKFLEKYGNEDCTTYIFDNSDQLFTCLNDMKYQQPTEIFNNTSPYYSVIDSLQNIWGNKELMDHSIFTTRFKPRSDILMFDYFDSPKYKRFEDIAKQHGADSVGLLFMNDDFANWLGGKSSTGALYFRPLIWDARYSNSTKRNFLVALLDHTTKYDTIFEKVGSELTGDIVELFNASRQQYQRLFIYPAVLNTDEPQGLDNGYMCHPPAERCCRKCMNPKSEWWNENRQIGSNKRSVEIAVNLYNILQKDIVGLKYSLQKKKAKDIQDATGFSLSNNLRRKKKNLSKDVYIFEDEDNKPKELTMRYNPLWNWKNFEVYKDQLQDPFHLVPMGAVHTRVELMLKAMIKDNNGSKKNVKIFYDRLSKIKIPKAIGHLSEVKVDGDADHQLCIMAEGYELFVGLLSEDKFNNWIEFLEIQFGSILARVISKDDIPHYRERSHKNSQEFRLLYDEFSADIVEKPNLHEIEDHPFDTLETDGPLIGLWAKVHEVKHKESKSSIRKSNKKLLQIPAAKQQQIMMGFRNRFPWYSEIPDKWTKVNSDLFYHSVKETVDGYKMLTVIQYQSRNHYPNSIIRYIHIDDNNCRSVRFGRIIEFKLSINETTVHIKLNKVTTNGNHRCSFLLNYQV